MTMIIMNPIKKLYFNNNESLIVYINHALLGFYLCQFRKYSIKKESYSSSDILKKYF